MQERISSSIEIFCAHCGLQTIARRLSLESSYAVRAPRDSVPLQQKPCRDSVPLQQKPCRDSVPLQHSTMPAMGTDG